jgi:hypothetical protein
VSNRGNWLVVGGLAVVLAALVVAAVVIRSGDDDDAAGGSTTTTTATTETSEPATTTTVPTTTTAPLSPEDEIRRSAADLFELRDEVLMNPDPARIAEYAEDQSPLYANDRGVIDSLVAAGARWGGDPGEVLGVRMESGDMRNPQLSVVVDTFDVDVVDASGQVLQHLPAERRAYSISLLGAAGSWRINRFLLLDDALPSAVQDIISRGVP